MCDKKYTAPELRRIAIDLETAYSDDHRDRRDEKAALVAAKLRAQADLDDALTGETTGTAAECHIVQRDAIADDLIAEVFAEDAAGSLSHPPERA